MTTAATAFHPPLATEHDPYYGRYISLVHTDDLVAALEKQIRETTVLLSPLTESQANFRYAPDKWSVKEIVGHLSDSERILSYRVLRIARGDKTPIEGFEQDDYVPNGKFGQRTMADLLEEFADVRKSTVQLLKHLDAEAVSRRGTANQKEITVRALA